MNEPHWQNTRTKQGGFGTNRFKCGYCDHRVAASEGYWCVGKYDSLDSTIAICPECNRPTYFERHQQTMPLPAFGEKVPNINDSNVEALYEEARGCTAHGSFTSAVMLCRKLLMHIAVQQGAEQNLSFVAYVEYLDAKGYVPPNGKDWVDQIRSKGNEANHEIRLMAPGDAKNMVRFSEMLLRFIYEMPNMLKDK
jgi:hypothetical protein